MTEDLQNEVAGSADRVGSHATAPALLLQAQAALGQLAATADLATESGRRPFRIEPAWGDQLGELGHLVYLLADQTGVNLDQAVRRAATRSQLAAYARSDDSDPFKGTDWM
jgi:hypothetical protein